MIIYVGMYTGMYVYVYVYVYAYVYIYIYVYAYVYILYSYIGSPPEPILPGARCLALPGAHLLLRGHRQADADRGLNSTLSQGPGINMRRT